MYYPDIKRRNNYKRNKYGVFYSDYKKYYDEIAEDCLFRCVYCDILIKENGGEGMHLDHFRPQAIFPGLSSSPFNLVLACAKCNQLKSDWWIEPSQGEEEQYCGFVDHFEISREDYFTVSNDGEIVPKKLSAKYMVDLMHLNRSSRCSIRKMRAIKSFSFDLLKKVEEELASLMTLSEGEIKSRLPNLVLALQEIRSMVAVM